MKRRWSFAWRMSFRFVLPWLALLSIGVAFVAMLHPDLRYAAVGMSVPLIAAIQGAFVFAPDDEPALELLLAAPRPPSWLIIERLAWVLALQIGVGVMLSLLVQVTVGRPNLLVNVLWWLPPTLVLSGFSLLVTLMMRRSSFGVLSGVGVFALMLFFFNSVVAQQLWLYPIHLFLEPGWFSDIEYVINRVVVSLLGVVFIIIALVATRDTENLLGAGNHSE